jgi:O-antigen/teichoic acid export membrane protein
VVAHGLTTRRSFGGPFGTIADTSREEPVKGLPLGSLGGQAASNPLGFDAPDQAPAVHGLSDRVDRRMAGNAAWLFAGQAAILAAGIFVVAITSRVLGPAELGHWRLAQSLTTFIVVLGDAGLSLLATRQIARDRSSVGPFGRPVLVLRLALTLPLMLVMLTVVAATTTPETTAVTAVVSLTAIAMALTVGYLFQGLEDLTAISRLRIVTQLAVSCIAALGALFLRSILAVAAAFVAGAAILAAVPLMWALRKGLLPASPWGRTSSLELLRQGLPFLGSALAVQTLLHGGGVIIAFAHGTAELGLYAAPFLLASYMLLLGGAVMAAAYPRIAANSHALDRDQLVAQLCGVMGVIGLPLAIGGILVADDLVPFLFGSEFRNEANVFRLLMAMPLLGYFSMTLGQALIAWSSERAALLVAGSSAVLSIGLALALVPALGALGAAVAVAGAEIASAAGYLVVLRRHRPLRLVREYLSGLPVAVAAGAAAVTAGAFGASVIVAVLASVLVYAVLGLAGAAPGFQTLKSVLRDR